MSIYWLTYNAICNAKIFFTYNAMSKIFSDNTNMYGIPENPMIDTKNTNLPLLWLLLLDLEHITAILDSLPTMQCLKYFRHYLCVGHTLKPYSRHQKYESASIVLKMISIYCLTNKCSDKWRPSWILPTMQCPKLLMTTPLDRAYLKTLLWTPKSWSCSYSVENCVNLKFNRH